MAFPSYWLLWSFPTFLVISSDTRIPVCSHRTDFSGRSRRQKFEINSGIHSSSHRTDFSGRSRRSGRKPIIFIDEMFPSYWLLWSFPTDWLFKGKAWQFYCSHRTDFSGRSRPYMVAVAEMSNISSHRTDFSGRSRHNQNFVHHHSISLVPIVLTSLVVPDPCLWNPYCDWVLEPICEVRF